jgi:leucyl aminopeptidase
VECPGLPLAALEGLPVAVEEALQELLTSGLTGLYSFDAWKTRDVEPPAYPKNLVILAENEPSADMKQAADSAGHHAAGVSFARDLVAAPANGATPSDMVAAAQGLADRHGFRIEVIDMKGAEALGMGAFTAVAQGSSEPAYVIVLEHCPPGTEKDAPLVLVGKGITFDTGGISLKPSLHMEAMKQDMAGAAAVLGAFEIIGRTKLARRVAAILPCTENMPGGKAYKPGDVLRTLSGLTVEVISTDAEGRLILCDALAYALRMKPAAIVDIATLTGACIVALGNRTTGILGNNEKLMRSLIDIGASLGDKLWQLPLWDFYFDHIKSDVADFKNVGDRTAGTIVASIFLKQFVPDEVPWAHLDIAGTAWTDKDLPGHPKGPTGSGARLLAEFVRQWPQLGITTA